MRFYHPYFLVRMLYNRYGVPLIMDEIAVRFGYTGAMFAFHHFKAYQGKRRFPKNLRSVSTMISCL